MRGVMKEGWWWGYRCAFSGAREDGEWNSEGNQKFSRKQAYRDQEHKLRMIDVIASKCVTSGRKKDFESLAPYYF